VTTPRELVADGANGGTALIAADMSAVPENVGPTYGYATEAVDGGWRISAPPGEGMFSPWISIPIGSAEAMARQTYMLSARAKLTELPASANTAGHFYMRFYNFDGIEIPHKGIATDAVPVDSLADVRIQAVAPEGTARVTAEFAAMLPAGRAEIESVEVTAAQTALEQFAAEEPLDLPADHPRALMSAEQAAAFPQKVLMTERGKFGASPADLFATIVTRADGYLTETDISFGKDQAMPWPPTHMPQEGGGLSWNPLAGALAERLKSLSVAYVGTGDERYGNRAKDLLLALCGWDAWCDPVND
jgi:hypothetical protein